MNRRVEGQEVPVFFESWDEGRFSHGTIYNCVLEKGGRGRMDLCFSGRGGEVISVRRSVAERILKVRDRFVGQPMCFSDIPILIGVVEALVLDDGDDEDPVIVGKIGLAVRHEILGVCLYEVVFPQIT